MSKKEKCEVDRDTQRETEGERAEVCISLREKRSGNQCRRGTAVIALSRANLGFTHSNDFTKQEGQRQDQGEKKKLRAKEANHS